MNQTTLSIKNQIVVPQKVRETMKLKAGVKLALYPLDEYRAILVKRSFNYVKALQGLGKDVWRKLGGTDAYLRNERLSWKKS